MCSANKKRGTSTHTDFLIKSPSLTRIVDLIALPFVNAFTTPATVMLSLILHLLKWFTIQCVHAVSPEFNFLKILFTSCFQSPDGCLKVKGLTQENCCLFRDLQLQKIRKVGGNDSFLLLLNYWLTEWYQDISCFWINDMETILQHSFASTCCQFQIFYVDPHHCIFIKSIF